MRLCPSPASGCLRLGATGGRRITVRQAPGLVRLAHSPDNPDNPENGAGSTANGELACGVPAVNVNYLPIDVFRGGRGEEKHGIGDVCWAP